MRDIKSFLSNVSVLPGVYQMLGEDGVVLYVGKAKNLKKRIGSYFSGGQKDPKTTLLVRQIKDIAVTITRTENEAVLLECNLIKKLKPRYNVLLRDDKSYPYIFLSGHTFPRLDIYRGKKKKSGRYFGPYPNSQAVREAISLLQKIFLIRTCRDAYFDARIRPCLLYQINRCSAPCVDFISKDEYASQINLVTMFLEGKSNDVIDYLQYKMELSSSKQNYEQAGQLRDQITRLRQLQDKQYVSMDKGNMDVIVTVSQGNIHCLQLFIIRRGQISGSRSFYPSVPAYSSESEVLSSFLSQYYLDEIGQGSAIPKEIIVNVDIEDKEALESVLSERASRQISILCSPRGEKQKLINLALASAKQSLTMRLTHQTHLRDRFLSLKETLHLDALPERLECFDISHTMGEATVASCVVFDQNGPLKSDYRRYHITDVTPGDDVAAMKQVIARRFKHALNEDAVFPDVIFIDGGKTQLAAAYAALESLNVDADMLLIGVSKGPGRKAGMESLHKQGKTPIHLPADSMALHLIQHIRDEAHRFAITGHRMKRDKKRKQSVLETIPGVGAKRRRELLRYFGGIQGVSHASLDELMKVQGISRSLAERIFEALHGSTS